MLIEELYIHIKMIHMENILMFTLNKKKNTYLMRCLLQKYIC